MTKPKIKGLDKLSIEQLENLIEYIEDYKSHKMIMESCKRLAKEGKFYIDKNGKIKCNNNLKK